MKSEHFRQIWTYLGLSLLFYSSNAWLAGQGAHPPLDLNLIDTRRIPGAVWAFLICGGALILQCRIGRAFAKRQTTNKWHKRMPVLFYSDIDSGAPSGRWYQVISLGGLIVLPSLSLIHFARIVSGSDIHVNETPSAQFTPFSGAEWSYFLSGTAFSGDYRIGESWDSGISWIPTVQPVLMTILGTWVFVELVRYFRSIF